MSGDPENEADGGIVPPAPQLMVADIAALTVTITDRDGKIVARDVYTYNHAMKTLQRQPEEGDLFHAAAPAPPPRPDPLLRPAIIALVFAGGAFCGAAAVVAVYFIALFQGGV